MTDIFVALKSSMDRMLADLVTEYSAEFPGLFFAEMDDSVNVQETLSSTSPALLYVVSNPAENPRKPLYTAEFAVGAKTNQDKGNYRLVDLVNRLQARFSVGTRMELRDYSGTTGQPPLRGSLLITQVDLDYQKFDRVQGVRMFSLRGKILEAV